MTINLPKDLESSVRAGVLSGHFESEDDLVAAAVRAYLRQQPTEQLPTKSSGAALTPEELADQKLQRRLLEAGIISEIKPPPRLLPVREHFTPVEITGEPLSETIIRERR